MSYLNELLKDKINQQAEVEIHFFEYCNFSCSFCGQDHDDKTGMNTIQEKVKHVLKFMDESPMDHFIINMMGGELFNDLVPSELFNDYYYFTSRVFRAAQKRDKTCTFNWVTNLSFTKHHRVLGMLEHLRDIGVDTNLSTSYDFTGRPLGAIKNTIFYKNLERFKDYIYTIGFVLTKPSIKSLLKGPDEFFEYLYENHPLYFDYYVPEKKFAKTLTPSDQEQLDAFLYIAKHYPKVAPVSDWLNNKQNKLTCYSTNKITILPDGKEVTCRYLTYDEEEFETEIDYNSNENILEAHMERNQCLTCEYFDRCSFTCFVQADWAEKKRMEDCLYREFFRRVDNGLDSQDNGEV